MRMRVIIDKFILFLVKKLGKRHLITNEEEPLINDCTDTSDFDFADEFLESDFDFATEI
jgi:hypothetical protein